MRALIPSRGLLPRNQNTIFPAFNSASWTCRRCLSSLRKPSTFQPIKTGTKTTPHRSGKIVLGVLGGTVVGAAVFGIVTDVGHTVAAVERAGRVASALALCINDYRVTLRILDSDPDNETVLSKCHKRCAERTYKVLEKNGSIFIKLGQHLAAMGYLLPVEWTETFIPLQDRCPVSSMESIEKMILEDTGHSIPELFSTFDPVPLGAASLAQVHRAILRETGQEVAVKLQHPSLAEWIPLDMQLTRFSFEYIKWFFPEYPLTWLSDEMEASLPQELDFEREASNIHRVTEYFKNVKNTPVVIPKVIWAKPRILVMEYLPGKRLDDLQWLDSNGISRDEVSAALARIFNEMVFGKNAPLHCDPHGGNLAIRLTDPSKRGWRKSKFEIILYDHGLYREIPMDLRRSYAKLWLAVIDGNEKKMRRYANEVAGITDEQFPLFASAITGRDFTALQKGVALPRNDEEKKQITQAMTEGLLEQLIQLLANVPSVILLILKTNDLTRSLDEGLQTGRGPERTFMILARYCSRAVYEEAREEIEKHGGLLRAKNIVRWVSALWEYFRIGAKLKLFEMGIYWKEVFCGLGTTEMVQKKLLEG
ncbi:uncharacterized protein LAJ45_00846 [Morchella importuna]|uniref:ABC1-domain-containing protein n=1 Tax=Morchella conica CCBAS932 TaxID=1392247 RepID=A0A3N4KID8_9PEZI|nr:uncharacterized protein LAJ45_00846 [Morchella importuna]KAH8155834.1 hypothetical protein LAJ45_00846 [Morchella importuna]RPB10313.1 ABC1-domain-containing protein [Morchella conica CCBAS932]